MRSHTALAYAVIICWLTNWNVYAAHGEMEQVGCHAFPTATAKSLHSCLTLCDPIDGSPPGSPIPGILQARTLGWVAISFSNTWKWKVKVKSLSRVWLLVTPWTATYQTPLPMGFSRQEYWSGAPLPSLAFPTGVANLILRLTSPRGPFSSCLMPRSFSEHLTRSKKRLRNTHSVCGSQEIYTLMPAHSQPLAVWYES